MLKIQVIVYTTYKDFLEDSPYREYVMDHNDQSQRRVLGEQCRNAFEANQVITTFPLKCIQE